ncbi:alpha/beta fold hydrolase [soil metagenome]
MAETSRSRIVNRRFHLLSLICVLALSMTFVSQVSADPPNVAHHGPLATPTTNTNSTTVGNAGDGTFETAACPFELPEGLTDGDNVTCGYLTVPLKHEEPSGPTIKLAIAILKSTSANPAPEPLVLLNGGPGQGSDGIFPAFTDTSEYSFAPFLERQDVILFDQRGIGRSDPSLLCPGDAIVPASGTPTPGETPVPQPTITTVQDQINLYVDCLDDWSDQIALSAFNTKENAADVDSLRAALGYTQMDLLGISYGTRLGLEIMRDFPDTVRSVVLSSPLPPQVNLYSGQIIAFDQSLKKAFAGCEADAECTANFPDLEANFSKAVADLNAKPRNVTVKDPTTGESTTVAVDGATFLSAVYNTLFIGPLIPAVAPLVYATANGNDKVIEQILPIVFSTSVGIATGMFFAVDCQDMAAFTSKTDVLQEVQAAGVLPELSDPDFVNNQNSTFDICDQAGLQSSPAIEHEPILSDLPTLIFTGEFDPITPPSYGEILHKDLSNSTLIEVPGVGHDQISTGGKCVIGLVQSFLADPTTTLDSSCVKDLELDFTPS